MFHNYLKIALRNLSRHRIFSAINIFGLSIGLTACLLIGTFLSDELSYDRYPAQAAQLYRMNIRLLSNGGMVEYPMVDAAVGQGMQDNFPEVVAFTRLFRSGSPFVRYGDKRFKEEAVAYVDANFPTIFSLSFLEGDAKTALSQPQSVVITKALARKYFGSEPALGKLMTFGNGSFTRKVTGVIEEIPDNSHFHFNMLASMADVEVAKSPNWSNVTFYTYVVLKKGVDYRQLEAKFPQVVKRYVVPEVQRDMGVSLAEAQKTVNNFWFFLQPLTDIHLHSSTKYELENNGDIRYIYVFSALAIFILILAIVNFTNLSTANSAKRAREVGVRKLVGSIRSQLIVQFLTESLVLTFLALLGALLLASWLLPSFNELSGKHLTGEVFYRGKVLLSLLALGSLVGLLAGSYPAFFLSSFRTINVLKGSVVHPGKRLNLRSGLVVFQFIVSSTLIASTVVVYQQLRFMQDKKLGYDKEQVLVIQDSYTLGHKETTFKAQLLQNPKVVRASVSSYIPVGNSNLDGTMVRATDQAAIAISTSLYHVDYDYLATLGMRLVKGRNFSPDFPTDSAGVILNETAARELGWGNLDPIGKTLVRSSGDKQIIFTVVGVVEDFHFASLRQRISPLAMVLGQNFGSILVKVKTDNMPELLNSFRQQWDSFKSGNPFIYSFLDERFASVYRTEQRTGQIFTVFSALAILIACLGLYGLAAFTAEQRTKEIGIRKVLGASVANIVGLLSRDFIKLVLIANVIAWPLAWWAMGRWLQDFAYRVELGWEGFLLAGVIAVFIALMTVSSQAIKAAVANPVKALRTD